MERKYNECGGNVVVDSAFCRGNYEYLIKYAQDETSADGAVKLLRLVQAASLGQSAEWRMRAFKGDFPVSQRQRLIQRRW